MLDVVPVQKPAISSLPWWRLHRNSPLSPGNNISSAAPEGGSANSLPCQESMPHLRWLKHGHEK
jgi:hypothetical protein